MSWSILIQIMVLTIGMILSVLLNTYMILKSKQSGVFKGYIIVQMGLMLWMFGRYMELVSPTDSIRLIYISMQPGGILSLSIGFIYFIKEIKKKILKDKKLINMFYRDYKIAICISLIFTDCMAFLISGKDTAYGLTSFLAFGVFCGYIICVRDDIFVELSPASFENYMGSVMDMIAVFDIKGDISDYNEKFCKRFPEHEQIRTLEDMLDKLKTYVVFGGLNTSREENIKRKAEIGILYDNKIEYYIFSITTLSNEKGHKMGYVLSFHDITKEKNLEIELEGKNIELEKINKKLTDYIGIANQLEEARERTKVAYEIHNTIGKNIMELLTGLEALQHSEDIGKAQVLANLDIAIEKCRNVLKDIRNSVTKLMPNKKSG